MSESKKGFKIGLLFHSTGSFLDVRHLVELINISSFSTFFSAALHVPPCATGTESNTDSSVDQQA